MRPIWSNLLFAALLIAAGSAYAATQGSDTAKPKGPLASLPGGSPIRTHGEVEGLYPGETSWISLPLRNRSSRPVMVRSITAKVRDAWARCRADNLIPIKRRLRLWIPPRKRSRTAMQVRLQEDAGDDCQGAIFPLKFVAKTKAVP